MSEIPIEPWIDIDEATPKTDTPYCMIMVWIKHSNGSIQGGTPYIVQWDCKANRIGAKGYMEIGAPEYVVSHWRWPDSPVKMIRSMRENAPVPKDGRSGDWMTGDRHLRAARQ